MPSYIIRRRVAYYQEIHVEATDHGQALAQGEDESLWEEADFEDENIETMVAVLVCADDTSRASACARCGASTTDGEGWDGLCGACADKDEQKETNNEP